MSRVIACPAMPADGTRDREQIDRFSDFLAIRRDAPRREHHMGVTAETFRYLAGENVAPVAIDAEHLVAYWVRREWAADR